jgi:chemotaxis protein CheY-P-specific phosphatase CheC
VGKTRKRLKSLDSEVAQALLKECLDQTNRANTLENALSEENYAEVAEIMNQLSNSFCRSNSDREKIEKRRIVPIAARAPRRT